MIALRFEHDPRKAAQNLRLHGVSFDEAATSFFDPNAISEDDPSHSTPGDERFISIGMSTKERLLFVVHNEEDGSIRIISARLASPPNEKLMKSPESSASAKPAAVRGKYSNLLRQGTNIAILDVDIVDHFPDSESVNNALRAFLAIGKEVESAVRGGHAGGRKLLTKRKINFDPRKSRSNAAATAAAK